jgi:hypothetical protein
LVASRRLVEKHPKPGRLHPDGAVNIRWQGVSVDINFMVCGLKQPAKSHRYIRILNLGSVIWVEFMVKNLRQATESLLQIRLAAPNVLR